MQVIGARMEGDDIQVQASVTSYEDAYKMVYLQLRSISMQSGDEMALAIAKIIDLARRDECKVKSRRSSTVTRIDEGATS